MGDEDNIYREYLLGTLSEEETERIDERSITDADWAARLTAVDQDLTDAYAAGELSGSELQQFERHYLASPLRRQRVVFATAFQEFGAQSVTASDAAKTETVPSIFARFSPAFRWGFATAILVLIVTMGWLWLGRQRSQDIAVTPPPADQTEFRSPQPSPEPQGVKDEIAAATENTEPKNDNIPQANRKTEHNRNAEIKPKHSLSPTIAAFVLAPPTRGQVRSITIPSGTDRANFTLELESSDFAKYQLTLRQQGTDRVVWQSGSVSRKQAKVRANIPVKLLSQGIYTFSVTGIPRVGTSEIIGDYTFRVVQ